MAMTSVEFAFGIDDVVINSVTGKTGVIAMCAIDDGGKQYYVKREGEAQWWPERQLRHQPEIETPTPPQAG